MTLIKTESASKGIAPTQLPFDLKSITLERKRKADGDSLDNSRGNKSLRIDIKTDTDSGSMRPPALSAPDTGPGPSQHTLHQIQQQQQQTAQHQHFIQQAQRNMQSAGSSPKPIPGGRASVSPPLRTSSSFRVDEGYSEDMQIVDDLMTGKKRFQLSGDKLILPDWMLALDESIREGKFSARLRVAAHSYRTELRSLCTNMLNKWNHCSQSGL